MSDLRAVEPSETKGSKEVLLIPISEGVRKLIIQSSQQHEARVQAMLQADLAARDITLGPGEWRPLPDMTAMVRVHPPKRPEPEGAA